MANKKEMLFKGVAKKTIEEMSREEMIAYGAEITNMLKVAEDTLKILKEKILEDINTTQDFTTTYASGHCTYVKASAPTKTLDSKAVKEKYPEVFEECQKVKSGNRAYIKWG